MVITLIIAGLSGGLMPLLIKWDDRKLHIALSLSTGIFLGAIFLHMIPESYASWAIENSATIVQGSNLQAYNMWATVLISVVIIYFLKARFVKPQRNSELQQHIALSYASFLGLSLHALAVGLSLSIPNLNTGILLGLASHKIFESFSLASIFLLAQFKPKKIIILVMLFASITPIGIILGNNIFPELPAEYRATAVAIALGTFLYVSISELLPEVFHNKKDIQLKITLIIVGIIGVGMLHHD